MEQFKDHLIIITITIGVVLQVDSGYPLLIGDLVLEGVPDTLDLLENPDQISRGQLLEVFGRPVDIGIVEKSGKKFRVL